MNSTQELGEPHMEPFQNSADVTLFYGQCRRRLELNEIKKAVLESVSVLTLFGEEGSGKTMLCKMVELELSARYQVVLYDSAIMSFEDVIRPIGAKIGIDMKEQMTRKELSNLLAEILLRLQLKGERLLLVFDQADEIFLATLERIRKMLDILNEDGPYLQVLFSGKPSLQSNLDQLALCNFQGATERSFSLAPLDEEETFGYLKFQTNQSGLKKELFTEEISDHIYSLAKGNFAKTNLEAAKFVDDEVAVQPVTLAEKNGRKKERKKRRKISLSTPAIPGWLRRSEFISAIGVCCLVIVIAIVLLGKQNGEDTAERGGEPGEVVQQTISDGAKEKVTEPKKDIPPKDVPARSAATQEKKKQPDAKKQTLSKKDKKKSVEKTAVKTSADPEVIKQKEKKKKKKTADIQPVQEQPLIGKIETQPFIVISSESGRYISSRKRSPGHAVEQKNEPVDQLYSRRVAAARRWISYGDNGRFTVQIMVLTAEKSRQNVQKELARKEYRRIADELFILESSGSQPSVYIFYGDYPSKVSARRARNNLPLFLRKHDPYVTSIEDAMKKSGQR